MKNLFTPDYYVTSIYNINFDAVKEKGIENVLIDIDNTLMPWKSRRADQRVRNLVKELKDKGMKPCILSNSRRERVTEFVSDLGIEYSSTGRKPMKSTFNAALRKLGGEPENTCIIGDQIFTDILGGNRAGIYTILVDPLEKHELITTKWLRNVEEGIRGGLEYAKDLVKDEKKH
jgi:uncharacterized protein